EIDGFNQAVTERFGERTLLTNAAREPSGKLFDKLSDGMQADLKERLKEAWPVMRTAQQLSAHERTVQTLRQVEDLHLAQRQTPVMKQ
nr:conjugal transfer protein TraA [Agrobacterium rosae]